MPLTDLPRTPSKTLLFNLDDVDYTAQDNDTFASKELLIDLSDLTGARALYYRINRRYDGPRPPELTKIIMGLVNIMTFGGFMATGDVVRMEGKPTVNIGEYFYWVGAFNSTDNAILPKNPYDSQWPNQILTPKGDAHMDGKQEANSKLIPMSTYGSIDDGTKLLISMQSEETDSINDPFTIGKHSIEINGVF